MKTKLRSDGHIYSQGERAALQKQCMHALRGAGAGKKDQHANCGKKLGMKKK